MNEKYDKNKNSQRRSFGERYLHAKKIAWFTAVKNQSSLEDSSYRYDRSRLYTWQENTEDDKMSIRLAACVRCMRQPHRMWDSSKLSDRMQIVRTRSSADADKPARRVQRSVKVTKHSTIPYVRNSFLLVWNSNPVINRRRFSDIRLQKCCDLETRSEITQGRWRWYHSLDWVWFPISVLY